LSSKLCPECGTSARRSRARDSKERLIRALSPFKAYRCHECGWRGWLGNTNIGLRKSHLQKIIGLLLTLLITTLLALYLIER
jgi:uncharacterized protein with PIN domain